MTEIKIIEVLKPRAGGVLRAPTWDTIASYLPRNYAIAYETDDAFIVSGRDDAGWTAEEYVIPRLASGLHVAQLRPEQEWTPEELARVEGDL